MTNHEQSGGAGRPLIALTIGDPAGVGPELALQTAMDPEVRRCCRPILVGNQALLQRVAAALSIVPPEQIHPFSSFSAVPPEDDIDGVGVVESGELDASRVVPGHVDAETGRSSYAFVRDAIAAALAGNVAAMVTGPIHKAAWQAADIPFIGHTELLADMTRSPRVRMMLASDQIACALVTVHIGLAEVPQHLSTESIIETIRLVHETFSRTRNSPRITVCGLNPHAGESGLIGRGEEERFIVPAIQRVKEEGIDVTGPLPPDTAFIPHQRMRTDAYVCMYHDQGLIPLKALSFDDAVNVTLGLPIVRTSVDHGTALDLAWTGRASRSSFVAAVRLATKLIPRTSDR